MFCYVHPGPLSWTVHTFGFGLREQVGLSAFSAADECAVARLTGYSLAGSLGKWTTADVAFGRLDGLAHFSVW
jgi:hypothetical protein